MKRYNLVQRAGKHIGQLLSYDSEDKIFMFLKEIINIRKQYNIPIQNIVNMEETALMYNMPFNKTIHKVGAKTVMISTQKQDKARISCILSINATSKTLMPYIIFKGAEKGKIYKNLIKTDEVISKNCIISTNNNAWSTNKIVKDWIDTVYCSFFNNISLENTLLIFNSAPMHSSLEVLK